MTVRNIRHSMLVAGLLQGVALLVLHEWLKASAFQVADLVWVAPLYALALVAPLTFNILRGGLSARDSLIAALATALVIALTAAWFGWAVPIGEVGGSAPSRMREYWGGGAFVLGFSSFVAWFVALPFLQGGLRKRGKGFPYLNLFQDAWRNALLVANCLAFTGGFWLLLALWAGLFAVLKIRFFADLFTTTVFFYTATAMAISFAISLEEREASALIALRRYLLAFQTRLLPLAAVIVLIFIAALPFTGLNPLWNTGHATPLMLCLQWAMIILSNAAWQDGQQPSPFARPTQWLLCAALALLPLLSVLCAWSLSLRVEQYGWTVDRVWAAVLVGLTSLYAAGYAASVFRPGWLPWLGKVNTVNALVVISALLALHTPLLDPQRISATSQVSRLLAGRLEAEKFDYAYLRFDLGRAGNTALGKLAVLNDHPRAGVIGEKAKAAQALKEREYRRQQPSLTRREIANRLKVWPAGTAIDETFVEYLDKRLEKKPWNYELSALRNPGMTVSPLLSIDLGGDVVPEYVLMSSPYPVFTRDAQGWKQVGTISFGGKLRDSDISGLLDKGDYNTLPQQWHELRLGGWEGHLILSRE